jgi:hypothetical protein
MPDTKQQWLQQHNFIAVKECVAVKISQQCSIHGTVLSAECFTVNMVASSWRLSN